MEHHQYEQQVLHDLRAWQEQMLRRPTLVNQLAARFQKKVNSFIPEKVHKGITTTLRQMIKAVLFGAKITSRPPVSYSSLQAQEAAVIERIEFYKKTAAAEGGITGAGGILLGLADFPLLLSLKLKLLFEICSLSGFDVRDYRERVYLLHIFQLAFSSHQHRREVYLQMVDWETQKQHLPEDINEFDWRTFQQEYRDYIDLAKMAQLVPIIGAPVGAIANYMLLQKLGTTALNAYRMRYKETLHLPASTSANS
ncbi:ecsC [Rufibacter sp. DG15C]|uniref:EcsC family protein n=1 Tax=Rufibacter sp. DG15C TaxID=1379909 RepID=UPI00078E8980|nr:EcsC family protein [Rufibacter sp. DG15C]AMM52923.1 ecsC [Rufibacter sp. DG15C]